MAVSLTSSLSSQSTVASPPPSEPSPSASSSSATSKPEVQGPASAAGDTVKLSQAAQIHLLKQQGQALSQIASNLGVSVAIVDGYLGVTVPKAASATSPAASTPSTGSGVTTASVPAKG